MHALPVTARFALACLAVVSALTLLAVSIAAPAQARPTRTLKPSPTVSTTCRAEVQVFEDGTWYGARVFDRNGRLVAPAWEVTGPEHRGLDTSGRQPVWLTAYPAEVDGQVCTLVLA